MQFSESASMFTRVDWFTMLLVRTDLPTSGSRPGKGDNVLAGQVVEKIPNGAADELERTFGKHLPLDENLDHAIGEPSGGSRRFHDVGHTGQYGRRQFFEHAPGGEVVGVYLYNRSL